MAVKVLPRLRRLIRKAGRRLSSYGGELRGVWIDVGAHLGEKTLRAAHDNPLLRVYAFEPNLKVAMQCVGLSPNFVVIPMAVAEHDGVAEFYVNAFDAASSLLPFNSEGLQHWIGSQELQIERNVSVPTIRLDTFMNWTGIAQVDYLKVDAQGADFSVIKSAGERLKDIQKITLEVAVTSIQLYSGAVNKDEIIGYLETAGFALSGVERQSHDQEENLMFVRRS